MFYISPSLAERGAARLAHRSGGPGVGGSNPLAPTRAFLILRFAHGSDCA